MKKALEDLKQSIADIKPSPEISDTKWKEFTDNVVVALMSGGEGSRFKSVTGEKATHKNSFQLPNGDTMLQLAIRMYRDAGIKNFVALVYHEAKSVEDLLGDGSDMGVDITYSYDPKKPVGKGGAVLNALLNGSIPRDKHLIVHNPDDVIINYDGSFPRDIAAGHLDGVEKGNIATIVAVKETPYAFTGMTVINNQVTQVEMYPMIPIPTHIGVTLFSPEVYGLFEDQFNLEEKQDFEKVLFPILAKENKLYVTSIPNDTWLAVNNPKAFQKLLDLL